MTRTMAGRVFAIFALVLSVTACHSSQSPSTSSTAPSASAKLAVNQLSYEFPATAVGQTVDSSSFQLSVTGSGSLTIASITSSKSPEFTVTDVGSCVGAKLAAGASPCSISVRFQPAAGGVRSATVIAASSDGTSSVT